METQLDTLRHQEEELVDIYASVQLRILQASVPIQEDERELYEVQRALDEVRVAIKQYV